MTRSAATKPLDRAVATAALIIAVLALAAFAAVIIATFAGLPGAAWSEPMWVTITTVAYWGLPLALLLLIILVVGRVVRRQRDGAPTGAGDAG